MLKVLKWIGIGFVVLVVIGIIASGGDDKKTPDTATPNTAQESKEASTPVETKPVYDYTVDVEGKGKFQGKWSSDVGVAIVDIQEAKVIKGAFDNTAAGGKFYIIQLTVSNEQKDAITFDSALVKLVDNNGREYSSSSEGSTALTMNDKETLFLKSINPGITTSGYVVFDVPESLTTKDLKLKFRGGFTGKEADLPLMRLVTK